MQEVEVIKARNVSSKQTRGKFLERQRVAAYCRVSTDSEDQLNSYKSQKAYYTDLIKKNKEWVFVDIYADEAITGTQVTKREEFQRMINDCMNGDIDMVITKSISRFARNTLDTLKYVRMLKEKNIAVYFEDEKINTLTMDGELLLVVLSSVAQQEVENISANVKKGLKMKMKRGELVGFQGCLGYDYNKEDKTITVNEKEAEIVRYIFNRYIEGAGGSVIGQELENLGYVTKYGSSTWAPSTILGIIKNEKYKGDLLLGKTFTVDPISKRRLDNMGEEDQFYIREHHEPIISEEIFEKAQEILNRRNKNRGKIGDGKREKYSRKYAFSCMLECGFCGSTLSRRNWHSGSEYNKVIWQCVAATKKGKKYCPDSKGIPEQAIEEAFLESYRLLCGDNKDILDEFLQRMDDTLSSSTVNKQLSKLDKEIESIEGKKSKLVDMRLEDTIDKVSYEAKYSSFTEKQEQLLKDREKLQETAANEKDIKRRLRDFKKTLEQNEVLSEFDRYVFESIVEKVIVGGYDEDDNKDPAQLTFVYKTGLKNNVDGSRFKPQRKNARGKHRTAELCSDDKNEVQSLSSHSSSDTSGDGFYADGSFIQHNDIPYTGSYGNVLIKGVGQIFTIVDGTSYTAASDAIHAFVENVEKAFIPLIYQGEMLPMVNGRAISRAPSKTKVGYGSSTMYNLLIVSKFAPEDKQKELKEAVKYWMQLNPSYYITNVRDYNDLVMTLSLLEDQTILGKDLPFIGTKMYHKMDRFVQRTSKYMVGISMYSNRISSLKQEIKKTNVAGIHRMGWSTYIMRMMYNSVKAIGRLSILIDCQEQRSIQSL